MSKSLKKLIDINGLREFKNKLVGTGSAYVQTGAVDQTIAGTKTFSKPIVGSVTGSSGSCTGNAATATKLATARSLWGNNFDGSAAITGSITGTPSIEFKPGATTVNNGGYLDFHYNQSTADHTSRIIESASGTLSINNVTITTGKVVTATTFNGALTGNADTATKATNNASGNELSNDIIKGLSVSGRVITYTKLDGSTGTITTQDTNTDAKVTQTVTTTNAEYPVLVSADANKTATSTTTARFSSNVKINPSTNTITATTFKGNLTGNAATATTAKACTGNAATATKATQDAAGNTITTTYATKAENNTKANNSEVVHKRGDETIAGTKTFSNGVLSTASNAFMAQAGEYTLLLRHDSQDAYLLMSDKGGAPGTWSDARPLVIHNSTGVCNINGNAATATNATNANHAKSADSATKLAAKRTIALSGAATGTATGFDGSGNITIPVTSLNASKLSGLAAQMKALWYAGYPDGAEAHNAMWGGRNITAAFNNGTVSANIKNGTFRDIFPGDYITKQVTISGTAYTVNWVIADCDYWINKGDTATTVHHVVIVPQAPIFRANMNATNTTKGGYSGSAMFKNTIPACATGIVNAFGSSHILTFRDGITDSVDTSHVSSGLPFATGTPGWWGKWVSVQCNLMSEKMVYGAPVCSAGAMDNSMATRQMSAFRLSEKMINYNREWWWLRDVVSSMDFALMDDYGRAYKLVASNPVSVRPFALLV